MHVRGPNNVGRAVKTLLRYTSVITKQKKCWELLAQKFDRFQTLRNTQQHATTCNMVCDAACNTQECWESLDNNVASVCTELKYSLKDFSFSGCFKSLG